MLLTSSCSPVARTSKKYRSLVRQIAALDPPVPALNDSFALILGGTTQGGHLPVGYRHAPIPYDSDAESDDDTSSGYQSDSDSASTRRITASSVAPG
jgi:hypothetical protein